MWSIMTQKDFFIAFLQEEWPASWQEILPGFEALHALLLDYNSKINLFSRQTDPADLWTLHFLDSLLLEKAVKLQQGKVLDFGSGGGLPGIPLKLVHPELEMFLLDAKQKKVKALQEIILSLHLTQCQTVWSRIEDYQVTERFDYIVCRSVKILPPFKTAFKRLLKPDGKLLLYKSKSWEDAEIFTSYRVHDVSHEAIGTRTIIEIGTL
jgi:16S rRNA (guanine527-N7)-methyltransferase